MSSHDHTVTSSPGALELALGIVKYILLDRVGKLWR